MLSILTGLPGSGKSLYAMRMMHQQVQTGRPVYAHGIPDLTLDGVTTFDDPTIWHELPTGSYIVIDEAHRTFPNRKSGEKVPLTVQQFTDHRHRGHDVLLITQQPQQLDYFVRGIVQRHHHVWRVFGMEKAKVYQWQEYQPRPRDRDAKGEALTEDFPYPKEYYGFYKSADLHTVQKDIPLRKFALAGGLVAAVVGLLVMANVVLRGGEGADVDSEESSALGAATEVLAVAGDSPGVTLGGSVWDPEQRLPRLRGLAMSGPMFDSVAGTVATMPRIEGCADLTLTHSDGSTTGGCRCFSQRGTDLQVSQAQCRDFMAHGWFDWTLTDDEWEEREAAKRAQFQPQAGSAANPEQPEAGPPVGG